MLDLLLSDAYRLLRSRVAWVATLCLVLFGVLEAVVFAARSQGGVLLLPGFFTIGTDIKDGVEVVELTQALGQAFFSGGFLTLVCSLVAAVIATQDFSRGFERNLLSEGVSLGTYLAEKVMVSAALCLFVLLVASGSYWACALLLRSSLTLGRPEEVLLWLGLAWLHLATYADFAVVVAWASRKRTVGLIAAALLGSGVVGMLLWSVMTALALALPPAGVLASWLPYCNGQVLGEGVAVLSSIPPESCSLRVLESVAASGVVPWAHVLVVELVALCVVGVGVALLGRRGLRWW